MSTQNTPQKKHELRERFLEIRASMSKENARLAAEQCRDAFLEAIEIPEGAVVSAYYPAGSEFNTMPLMEVLHERGVCVALPHVATKDVPLIFREWKKGEPLVRNSYFHIYEPAETVTEVIPDIVIMPLVAFDKNGNRLGFGGGYFDRSLEQLRKRNPNVLAIGVAFACQEADEIPTDGNDQYIDWIITEKGARTCR